MLFCPYRVMLSFINGHIRRIAHIERKRLAVNFRWRLIKRLNELRESVKMNELVDGIAVTH